VVLVMAPLREVAEALCGWIERWGGRASPASAGLLATAGPGSLLLEVLAEDPPANRSWPGARVLMCGEGHLQPERRGADWVVGLHCLDAVRRALALARGGDEARPGAVIEAPAPAPADLAGLRVLMVEDNPINQLILRDQLEALGCCVSVASDGRQALQRWLDGHFEVILTDLNMPRMDGYQLAAELRRRGCRLPIIGATANAMREEREHCLAAGMNACLLKPVDLQTLACCLRVARSRP
ncbi:response regulator, partial [Pseudomonas citronellolis]|uniref:response regulator n=1 Tax=Pseudomonas citronellolis TaxID=53408 RepID=UPI0023E3F00D